VYSFITTTAAAAAAALHIEVPAKAQHG
jgi:hypothetical protein